MSDDAADRRELGMLHRVQLLTRSGDYVITAVVPAFNPPAEVIGWGSRLFVLNAKGEYREGMLAVPARTTNEREAQAEQLKQFQV